jgi:hemolysin III
MREPFSGLSHLAGGVLAAVGLLALLAAAVSAGSAERGIAFGIYGGSLVGLYAASALYHLLPVSAAATSRLRKLDHAMIYVLIAGTYTPVCLLALEGIWRWGLLGVVWTLALGGVALKLRRVGERPWLTVALYLGLGWLAVAVVPVLVEALPAGALFWLAAGGLVYTVGAVVYATKRPDPMPGRFGYHELWHLFVLAGSACHFWALARYVAPLG